MEKDKPLSMMYGPIKAMERKVFLQVSVTAETLPDGTKVLRFSQPIPLSETRNPVGPLVLLPQKP